MNLKSYKMAKYESSIKQVPYSQSAVYAKVSDLTNLEKIKERFDDPNIQSQIPDDKKEEVRSALSQMEFTKDTLSGPIGPIGNIAVAIVEREPEKCVKFASTSSPISFKLWIQMLPITEDSCKIKVTIDADINFFMKQVLNKPLKQGVEKFAEMLAMIPY